MKRIVYRGVGKYRRARVLCMSYNLTVVVKEGQASVSETSNVPDGTYVVTGHDDDARRDLGVTRRGPDGRYVGAAHSSHYKEQ